MGLRGALPPVLHYEVCSGFWEVAKDEIINGGTVEKAGAETEVPV